MFWLISTQEQVLFSNFYAALVFETMRAIFLSKSCIVSQLWKMCCFNFRLSLIGTPQNTAFAAEEIWLGQGGYSLHLMDHKLESISQTVPTCVILRNSNFEKIGHKVLFELNNWSSWKTKNSFPFWPEASGFEVNPWTLSWQLQFDWQVWEPVNPCEGRTDIFCTASNIWNVGTQSFSVL